MVLYCFFIWIHSVYHCIFSVKGSFHCVTALCTANSAIIVILIIFDLLSPAESKKTMCCALNCTIVDPRDKLEETLKYSMQI